jgi:hypothetical protein
MVENGPEGVENLWNRFATDPVVPHDHPELDENHRLFEIAKAGLAGSMPAGGTAGRTTA